MEHQQLWVSVLVAVIGVAIVAVIFSAKSSTSSVISAATSGFSQILGVAVSPVTSNTPIVNTASPGGFGAFTNGLSAVGANASALQGLGGVIGLAQAAGPFV